MGEYTKLFNAYLASKDYSKPPVSLYEPFPYILKNGGKRIRPTLLLAANQLFNGNLNDALPAAMAIELFHNFTLIHDDIMDEADLRRNEPTVHRQFGTNNAILSGDVMMVYAYKELAQSPNFKQSFTLFSDTAIAVCEGQQMDMDFEQQENVSINNYLKMIENKTAILVSCALQLGAITANAPQHLQEAIASFGLNLGISFQIMDDILDVYADKTKFGKKVGGDIIQNKKTYLLLRAFELSNVEQKNELNSWLNATQFKESDKVNAVKDLYEQNNVLEDAKQKAEYYYQKSLEHLSIIEQEDYNTELFRKFAAKLLHRQS